MDDLTEIKRLIVGDLKYLLVDGDLNQRDYDSRLGSVLFPGAFNPLHAGHRRMAEITSAMLGKDVAFELSIENVDKPLLTSEAVLQRLRQFSSSERIFVTRAATFVEKARAFVGTCFIVGADTITRIADPKYYDSLAARDRALIEIVDRECTFLVFGRVAEGEFQSLDQLELPSRLREACHSVDEQTFRDDISSTSLRREAGEKP